MIRIAWVLLLLILTAGCGPDGSLSMQSLSRLDDTNLIPLAPAQNLSYHCTRTFQDLSVDPPRIYREEIWHRSPSEFLVTCTGISERIDGAEVPCSAEDLGRFNEDLARSGLGRYVLFQRGFNIQDAQLFLDNYNYIVWDEGAALLGRIALQVRVLSKFTDRPSYTVWLDRETGLVLKYIEDTLTRNPLSVMEVTSLELDPDMSGIAVPRQGANRNAEEIELQSAAQEISFTVYDHRYLPQGFFLQSSTLERLNQSEGDHIDFVNLVYTDGLQTIKVLQFKPLFQQNAFQVSPDSNQVAVLNFYRRAGLFHQIFLYKGTQFAVSANSLHEEHLWMMIRSLIAVN